MIREASVIPEAGCTSKVDRHGSRERARRARFGARREDRLEPLEVLDAVRLDPGAHIEREPQLGIRLARSGQEDARAWHGCFAHELELADRGAVEVCALGREALDELGRWVGFDGVGEDDASGEDGPERVVTRASDIKAIGETGRCASLCEGQRLGFGQSEEARDTAHPFGVAHRNAASRTVAASVLPSRYLTMQGAESEMPRELAKSPRAGREPGTTTAPSGTMPRTSVPLTRS